MRVIKEVKKKITVWLSTLRNEGFIEFTIQLLRFVQKNTNKIKRSTGKSDKHPIYTRAGFREIEAVDFSSLRHFNKRTENKRLSIAWIMPPPGKGSGGHLNIFRFIQYLEGRGHQCLIYIYVDGPHSTIQAIREIMGDSYPKTEAVNTMRWLNPTDNIPDADAIFCTSWETAYASYALSSDARRFYFIQDFEPYFYPRGGMYILAENTYRLGYYGITAGGWLKEKLSSEYGMSTDSYDFGADQALYSYKNDSKRKEIFCYVRPYTERRGFEIAILTLDIFHQEHPDYTINLVGWDVSEYDIPFPYSNPGLLEVSQLNVLYNRCAAALVLSYTNMSLLPLELLACGTIPVVNDGPNNRLVSDNQYIGYAESTPRNLANKLSEAIKKAKPSYAKKAAESVPGDSWDISGEKFVDIVEREVKRS